MNTRRVITALAAMCCATGCGTNDETGRTLTLQPLESGTAALLQAVSAVDDRIVWVSGHQSTYARTLDGGQTWRVGTVKDTDTLQFRDVHAVSADTAYLLAAGPGEMSRIYKTTDAGVTWVLQFLNRDPEAFFDCFDFWDADRGVAFSDAVGGYPIILRTLDGGERWEPVSRDGLPRARGTEGAFAASGTCVVTLGTGHAWIGTGAGDVARVLRTWDGGTSWDAVETPIVGGSRTTGIASLVFLDATMGFAFGGDISDPDTTTDNAARTNDGGTNWTLTSSPSFSGAVYGAAAVPGRPGWLVAVGPRGLAYTTTSATTWHTLDTLAYWAVAFGSSPVGWAVGPGGRIVLVGN